MEKGRCGVLTQNINLISSKHWKNSLFPQHLHFILRQRRRPGRWKFSSEQCNVAPGSRGCWSAVICCHPRAEFEWALGGTSWMRWGDAVSSGFPDSTSGVCSSLLFTVGVFKRRMSGVCWLLSGKPNFSKRQAVLGTEQNPLSSTVHQDCCRVVPGAALWRRCLLL